MTDSNAKQHGVSAQAKNYILLISVPLVLIGLLAAAVFIPRLLANPQQDFLYSECPIYVCDNEFVVQNGVVVQQASGDYSMRDKRPIELYYYDVSEGTSQLISLEEAEKLQIHDSKQSSDGYELELRYTTRNPTDESRWVLRNGLLVKPVNITTSLSYSTNAITFIGWVDEN